MFPKRQFFKSAATVCILSILSVSVQAQSAVWESTRQAAEKKEKPGTNLRRWKDHIQEFGLDSTYNHSVSIGGRFNTNGWTGLVAYQRPLKSKRYRGKNKNAGKSETFQLSFSEVIHEKQIKQQRENTAFPELGASTPYIFGKINNLYLLQLGYGREQMLLPGLIEGNISVSFRYMGGFSLALLKPYYLKLIQVEYTPEQVVSLHEQKYSAANAEVFLSKDRILGSPGFSKGLREISYIPGALIEGVFVIRSTKSKTFIQIVTLGGQISVHIETLPTMAELRPRPLQTSLFVGLQVGKMWK